nr:GtrA family protein [Ramlibacter algicola]
MAERHPRLWQLARFGVVGVATNLLGYGIYLVVALWVEPKLAVTLLYPIGIVMGYTGHARYAFNYAGGHGRGLARYLVAHAFGYGLNLALLYVFVDRLGMPHQLVQFVAIFVVGAFLFVLYRLWVFRGAPDPRTAAALRNVRHGSAE